jgi:hypothetical protein
MEAFREAIVAYFDIGKQKVVWILKCREQHEEAAGNALREAYIPQYSASRPKKEKKRKRSVSIASH